LGARLLVEPPEALSRLTGVAGERLLVVSGDADALPWVDGVTYLGRTPEAPALLLPTAFAPSWPVALLERALLRQANGATSLAVLIDPPLLVPLAEARRLDRAAIERWLDSQGR
jgi:hypothetical protein